jgi:cell wall assembly regulator SMI1
MRYGFAMAASIAEIWDRAHRWLEPRGATDWLRHPATPSMIARAETALGVTLPDDIRASWLIHDGQEHDLPALFAGVRLLSFEDIVGRWRWMSTELASEGAPARGLPPGVVRDAWYSPSWIPIAGDEAGNHVVCDLEPGPSGARGQLVFVYAKHHDRPRIAPTFTQFLDERVAEWESDAAQPVLDEDGLLERMRMRSRWLEV